MNIIIVLTLLAIFDFSLASTIQAQTHAIEKNKKTVNTILLDDFEEPSSLKKWNGTISHSKKFPAHGKYCVELKPAEGQPLRLESENLNKNWNGFDCLRFDIYNPSPLLHYGSIHVFDDSGTDEEAEFHGQSYNGEKLFLNTGWNHYEFILRTAMVEQGDRSLQLDRIRKLRFSFGSIGHSLYLDNLRLTSGPENATTASRMNPNDCRVVIDNRYIYSTLAGPAEKLKPNPHMVRLRKDAISAVSPVLMHRSSLTQIFRLNREVSWPQNPKTM